jgi:uncharacterized repeat protein (TIGR01451 family)
MKVKLGLLLAFVLSLGVYAAVFSNTQSLSAPPQAAGLKEEPQAVVTPPPPPGCRMLAFTTEPKTAGTVTVAPDPNCGGTWYTDGTIVTLTAVPAPGYAFSHWVNSPVPPGTSGSTDPVLTLTMDYNHVAIAHFTESDPPPPPGCRLLQYTSNPTAGGTVDVSPEPNCGSTWYQTGTNVTLTATPNNGYNFSFWTISPDTPGNGSTNPVVTILIDDNYTAVANYSSTIICHQIVTVENPPGSGTAWVETPENCPHDTGWIEGTAVIIMAEGNMGWEFVDWTDSEGIYTGSTLNPLVLASGELTSDRTLTANFTELYPPPPGCKVLQLTINPTAGGAIVVDPPPNCGGSWYTVGTDVTLTAVPNNGYVFLYWSLNPVPSSNPDTNSPVISFQMDDNYTAVANFSSIICNQIETGVSPPDTGTAEVLTPENCPHDKGWIEFTGVSIRAEGNVGWEFVDWTDSEGTYTGSTFNPLIISYDQQNSDRTITANFTTPVPDCYDIAVVINPPGEGFVNFSPPRGVGCPGGWVAGNIQIEAVADEPTAYQFDSWGGDAAPNGSANPGILTVDANKFIVANFSQVAEVADLYVQKYDITDPVTVGEEFMYVLIVGNNGPDTAGDIDIMDTLPASVTPVWATGGKCNIAGNVVNCELLPGLTAGSSWPIFIVAVPNSAGIITNTASVTGADPVIIDPDPTNNTVTETTEIVNIPISGLTVSNDSPTALGMTTTLTASITAGSGVSYTWDFGDGDNGTGANTGHIYAAPGIYTATVTATNSVSTATAETTILVEEAISGLTATTDSPTELGSTTTLTASITAGSNVSYTWDFDDDATGSGPIVNHTYTQPGIYTVTVTATNAVSIEVATMTVTVEAPVFSIFMPVIVKP